MYNTKILKQNINIHKLLTRDIADGKYLLDRVPNGAISKHQILGEHIALILANFKCEVPNCNSSEITIHHLINRRNRKITPINKYISQRHYFFNLVICCIEHHNVVDKENKDYPKDIIKPETIEKIKKEYEYKENDGNK